MDGEETTQHIRGRNDLPQPTIIAMTANVLEADRQRYLELGMDTYIGKPVRLQELADVLQRVSQTPS
ncbi:MAG: response regulator [Caldilineaceae bacterium]